MTGNERRLLLALEAVAVLALVAIRGADLAAASSALKEGEGSLAASMRAESENLASLSALREAAAKQADLVPLGAKETETPIDAEAAAERMRDICAREGLVVLRYAIVQKAPGQAVDFSVQGGAGEIAAALALARSDIPRYRVSSLSIKARERERGAEASLTLERLGEGSAPQAAPDISRVGRLFGAVPKPAVAAARAAPPPAPEAPERRIAFVGEVTTSEGVQFFFKDLDSGNVVRLGQGLKSPEGWSLAGRDGDILHLVIEGRNYRIPQR